MGGSSFSLARVLACAALTAFVACASSSDRLDLARNQTLYRTPNFHSKVAVDRTAFLGPVVDEREPVGLVEASGPYPTRWMAEGYWERPMPEMLDDCLREAFAESGVFAALQEAPPPAADGLVVEPHLVEGRAGMEERPFGRITLASVGIRVVVHGPAAADGSRQILIDERFDQSVGTEVSPQPQRMPVVFGSALKQVVARILARIDQSNVARSGMPIQAVPAEQR